MECFIDLIFNARTWELKTLFQRGVEKMKPQYQMLMQWATGLMHIQLQKLPEQDIGFYYIACLSATQSHRRPRHMLFFIQK